MAVAALDREVHRDEVVAKEDDQDVGALHLGRVAVCLGVERPSDAGEAAQNSARSFSLMQLTWSRPPPGEVPEVAMP